ncbi:hypothetical protein [Natronomonas sp.]|uniref:hypothetical protein n=1 Tax=Natronomonas sp. TaxID=2184060 RepID=UPI0026098F17|nr:hypothetical protein [Natronomonas sp.]
MTRTDPPSTPYDAGDRVRVRVGSEADSPFEGTVCRVLHVFADDPTAEGASDRETADAAYRLRDVETGEVLPIVLRHRDLRPAPDGDPEND